MVTHVTLILMMTKHSSFEILILVQLLRGRPDYGPLAFHYRSPQVIMMSCAFAVLRRRLIPLDILSLKRAPSVAASLKRPFASYATASLQKNHTTDVNHSRLSSSPKTSEKWPATAPKLAGAFTTIPTMSASSQGTQRNPTVSPPFEMTSSSKSRGSLGSRISGLSSQKNSSKRRMGKSKEQPSKSRLPDLGGPIRDAAFIEQEHRKNLGSRPDIKPVFVDNPKSPVANFTFTHLDKQPAYESVEGIVFGTSERVHRLVMIA